MYNALRTGILIPYVLNGVPGVNNMLAIVMQFLLYGVPLLIIVVAAVSKSKRGAVISLIVLSLLYGTDFLVLAIAALIVFYIAMIIIDKEH